MNVGDKPIIIVKKKVTGHGGHHGGSWKVAYADFVTAMMAFFLVMWIIGLSADTRKAIASYFNDPGGFMKTHAGGTNPMLEIDQSPNGKPTILPNIASMARAPQEHRFRMAKAALEKLIASKPEFLSLRRFIEIEVTPDGLRIELLEHDKGLFFESGSAALKPATVDLLRVVAGELRALGDAIVLEGYTDAEPYGGGRSGYSNWELSVDRANSARRAMEPDLRAGQVAEVRGYADRRLRYPADPYHYSNRRITILVPYSESGSRSPAPLVGVGALGAGLRPAPPDLRPHLDAAPQQSATPEASAKRNR